MFEAASILIYFLFFSVPFSENEDDEEDIETELICLSKGGIEKIECYDHDKVPSYTT